MARARYTDAQKAEALALYAEHGAAETHRRTHIPEGTLMSWAHRNGVHSIATETTRAAVEAAKAMRNERRERLRDEMLRRALDLLDRMDQPHIDFKGKDADEVTYPKPSPQGCQSYATAAAILLDKFRLEIGEATARTETVVVDQLDQEIARLSERVMANDPVTA